MARFEEILELTASLKASRSGREGKWAELSRWICPWRGAFGEEVGRREEEENEGKLFTGIAAQALTRGAAGMTSGMTPRNVAWFRTTFGAPDLDEAAGARAWLDKVDTALRDALADGGFYQAIHAFNTDLIWAGCALLYCERGFAAPLRFECCQVGSFYVATDQDGLLEAAARRIQITASEAARVFGEAALSEGSRRAARRTPFRVLKIWHVTRRETRDDAPVSGLARRAYPVKSWWFEEGGDGFLRESSFHETPYFFARWNEGPTPYGTGPGDECLADARQMDALERHKLAGIAKLADPPVAAPPSLKDYVDLYPGGVNYVTGSEQIRPILDLSPYAQALRFLREEIAAVETRLQGALMADIFAAVPLERRPRDMSATEYLERKRETLQRLGPVISAYEPTVLIPTLRRTLQTLYRSGQLPAPPDSLAGLALPMKLDFISPMANALRQTSAETARALFGDVAAIYQATQDPAVYDKIDADQLVDELAAGLGAPGSIVRADDDVAALREQRAKAQEDEARRREALELVKVAPPSPETRGPSGLDPNAW